MSEFAGNPDQIGHQASQGGRAETIRTTLYQEPYAKVVDQLAYVQAGQLFVATVGTAAAITGGTASHVAPTATDGTKALIHLKNNNSVASGKRIYPIRLELGITVQGANATSSRYYLEKSAAGVNRFTSGGVTNYQSTGLVLNSPGSVQDASNAIVRLGAVVTVADTSATLISEGLIRSIIPKFGDRIVVNFGEAGSSGATDYSTANAIKVVENVPATDLAPGETLCFHLVNAAQDAASSYWMKFVFVER